MRFIWTLFCLILLTSACQSGTNQEQNTQQEAPSATPQAPEATPAATLPSIPDATIKMLFDSCDYVDFVFHYTNFSISQNEQASIRGALAHISPQPAPMLPDCKPMGRIFYQVQGVNRVEADFYFSQNCLYYVFLENNKPKYANMMSEAGFNFYKNIFAQIQAQQQQQQQ
jgi:hypothetical protein